MMKVQPHSLKLLPLVAIPLLLQACGPFKAMECNKLIASINQVSTVSNNYKSAEEKIAAQARTVKSYEQQEQLLQNSLSHTRNIIQDYERATNQVSQTSLNNGGLRTYQTSLTDIYTRQIQGLKQLHDTVADLSDADIPRINVATNSDGKNQSTALQYAFRQKPILNPFANPDSLARERQAKVIRVKQSLASLNTQLQELDVEESGVLARINAYCGAPKPKS